jgi:hypothetical protein
MHRMQLESVEAPDHPRDPTSYIIFRNSGTTGDVMV